MECALSGLQFQIIKLSLRRVLTYMIIIELLLRQNELCSISFVLRLRTVSYLILDINMPNNSTGTKQ